MKNHCFQEPFIYVFIGVDAGFPTAVFNSMGEMELFIGQNKLTGIVNKMPVGISLYDWAIQKEFFKPKRDYQKEAKFIQSFSCASMEHWHFEDGEKV